MGVARCSNEENKFVEIVFKDADDGECTMLIFGENDLKKLRTIFEFCKKNGFDVEGEPDDKHE